MHKQKAFTLIELLVVIAIIGLLATVVVVSVGSVRAKGRDAKRVADMDAIKKAIEMYFIDKLEYPLCGSTVCSTTGYTGDMAVLGIKPAYLSQIPKDPSNVNGQYGYYYARGYKPTGSSTFVSTGKATDYIIATRLENSSYPSAVPVFSGWNNSKLNYLAGNSN